MPGLAASSACTGLRSAAFISCSSCPVSSHLLRRLPAPLLLVDAARAPNNICCCRLARPPRAAPLARERVSPGAATVRPGAPQTQPRPGVPAPAADAMLTLAAHSTWRSSAVSCLVAPAPSCWRGLHQADAPPLTVRARALPRACLHRPTFRRHIPAAADEGQATTRRSLCADAPDLPHQPQLAGQHQCVQARRRAECIQPARRQKPPTIRKQSTSSREDHGWRRRAGRIVVG